MAFCPSCGAAVEGRYCAKCGTAVDAAATPAVNLPAVSAPGLPENTAAALCYLLGWVTGIIFLILEPYNKNKLIRFHAFQSKSNLAAEAEDVSLRAIHNSPRGGRTLTDDGRFIHQHIVAHAELHLIARHSVSGNILTQHQTHRQCVAQHDPDRHRRGDG